MGGVSGMAVKTYKTTLGNLLFVVGMLPLCYVGSYWALTEKDTPIFIYISGPIFTIIATIFLFHLLKYKLTVTDKDMTINEIYPTYFNKYKTIEFAEIKKVWHTFSFFPDSQIIVFQSRHDSAKRLSIMFGSALSWQALADVVSRLPQDVQINFEPYVWRMIKSLPYESPRKIITAAIIITAIVILGAIYFNTRFK